jgi:hypothetical protein
MKQFFDAMLAILKLMRIFALPYKRQGLIRIKRTKINNYNETYIPTIKQKAS